jgi:hypothetical protein
MRLHHRIRQLEKASALKHYPESVEFMQQFRIDGAWMELSTCPRSQAAYEHAQKIQEAVGAGATVEEVNRLFDETPAPEGGRPWPTWP